MIPSIFRRVRNRLLISVKTMTTPTKAMIEAATLRKEVFLTLSRSNDYQPAISFKTCSSVVEVVSTSAAMRPDLST